MQLHTLQLLLKNLGLNSLLKSMLKKHSAIFIQPSANIYLVTEITIGSIAYETVSKLNVPKITL